MCYSVLAKAREADVSTLPSTQMPRRHSVRCHLIDVDGLGECRCIHLHSRHTYFSFGTRRNSVSAPDNMPAAMTSYETFPPDGTERSYGIIPLRFSGDDIEVLLIQQCVYLSRLSRGRTDLALLDPDPRVQPLDLRMGLPERTRRAARCQSTGRCEARAP